MAFYTFCQYQNKKNAEIVISPQFLNLVENSNKDIAQYIQPFFYIMKNRQPVNFIPKQTYGQKTDTKLNRIQLNFSKCNPKFSILFFFKFFLSLAPFLFCLLTGFINILAKLFIVCQKHQKVMNRHQT